jgi:hypothetical protein
MGTVCINGLTVYTFKIRVKRASIAHMALSYVLKQESELPLYGVPLTNKKGQEFVIYSTACTEWALASKIRKAIDMATGYALMHKADLKMQTNNAPPLVTAFYSNSNIIPLIIEEEELPF